jgi:hypothetical protein
MPKILAHKSGPNAGCFCQPSDELTSFRGEPALFVKGYPPRHEGSTGRVAVIMNGYQHEYFPSVFNLEWLDADA